jgi:hypothetical protein
MIRRGKWIRWRNSWESKMSWIDRSIDRNRFNCPASDKMDGNWIKSIHSGLQSFTPTLSTVGDDVKMFSNYWWISALVWVMFKDLFWWFRQEMIFDVWRRSCCMQ